MIQENETFKIEAKPNIGSRFIAGLVDYSIIFAFTFIYISFFGEPNGEGGKTVHGLLALVPTVFWGIITIGLEQFFGATLGNSLVGLKPISIKENENRSTFNGNFGKLSFAQSFKRHFLDPMDMFPFGLIGIITIKNTDKKQRLGDIRANTIVVKTSQLDKHSLN